MSIYKHLGRNYGFESTLESSMEVETMADEIEDFEEFHEEMVKESVIDMARVRGGMYVTEQLIENALFTAEESEVEALIEGAVGDFFTKVKENLMKLWKKIQAWFKHILEVVKRFFMSGKDLVKKYKSQIKTAAAKHSDIEVKCYKWDPDALSAKADAMINKLSDVAKTEASNAVGTIYDNMGKSNGEAFDMTEAKKRILKDGTGVEKVGEIAKEMKSVSRSGDKDKYTIGELNISKFMETVESQSKIIKTVVDANKKLDISMREGIADVDKIAKDSISKDAKNVGEYKRAASQHSELVRYAATLRTSVVKVFTAEVKTMSKQMTSVMKALINKADYKENIKGTKESAYADMYDLLGY